MKYPSENFIKTMDSAVRFLARDNHKNVAKLFRKSAGYTCELETHKGTFFESIVVNEETSKVEITIFWGISVSEEYRKKVEEYIRNINRYEEFLCRTGIDFPGRVYSISDLSFDICEIDLDFFESLEDACFGPIDLFCAALARVNAGIETQEDAFKSIVNEDVYTDPDLKIRHELMREFLELRDEN